MAMSYLMAREFDKAKTPKERMAVFLKYGFTEDRLIEEIRNHPNGGVKRADYDDPQSTKFCLEMVESGVRALNRAKFLNTEKILKDERFQFYSSLEGARREELRADPVVRFNRLISDYIALTINPHKP